MVRFFKKKEKISKKDKLLLEEYNKGKILQVDTGLDNKEYLKSLEDKPIEENNSEEKVMEEPIPEVVEEPKVQPLPTNEDFYKPGFKLPEERNGTEEVSE